MFKNFREEQTRADERELLIAKINDKYKFSISKNKITNTDFLNMSEKAVAEKFLKDNSIKNYIFFGELPNISLRLASACWVTLACARWVTLALLAG